MNVEPGYKEMELFGEKVVVRDEPHKVKYARDCYVPVSLPCLEALEEQFSEQYERTKPFRDIRRLHIPDAVEALFGPVPRETGLPKSKTRVD